jgi:hypothetical protein
MAWTKGESGNPNGRSKDKLFRHAIIIELKSRGEHMPELRQIARAAIDLATAGDHAARNFVVERLDGKVPRPVEVSEADEPAATTKANLRTAPSSTGWTLAALSL